jgi:TIR domain
VSAPIFISYSSKDRDIAETIYQALESRGHDCWISCRDVGPGENFQEAIVKALRSARVMVLVFTSNANNSDEIKKELVLAGRHHVTVVPVRVEDVVPNDAFSYEFATRQWIDLFRDWEREIELLATRIGQILQTDKPPAAGGAETAPAKPASRRPGPRPSSNQPLIIGAALAAVLLVIGGAVLYTRSFTTKLTQTLAAASPTPSPATTPAPAAAQQMAAPTPPPAPSPPPAAAAPSPPPPAPAPQVAALPPEPPAASQPSPDEAAWQAADAANTRVAVAGYLKDFSAGVHAQEAQLRLANLIRADATASKAFDGAWQTEWTCPNLGQFPGYTYRFAGQVKDGSYHGVKGVIGQPSSMVLDGKIEPDGQAGFAGEIIVGSSVVGLGAARGSPSDFHALARFDHASGNGKRIEGRPCTLSFMKQ